MRFFITRRGRRNGTFLLMLLLIGSGCTMQGQMEIEFVTDHGDQQVDVNYKGSLFTSFHYGDHLEKPLLYPIVAEGGTKVTRHHRGDPQAGERVDHPHHLGLWLNYGHVNGIDFWNNSASKSAEHPERYGWIRLQDSPIVDQENQTITYTAHWNDHEGQALLAERTTLRFDVDLGERTIVRTTQLTALVDTVDLSDNKEGFFAIRVTRALEHPSQKEIILSDEQGLPMEKQIASNDNVTGMYISATGITGENVWGTRAKWMALQGSINAHDVTLSIFDHVDNPGYPTYWHARPYGLFAANPLGQAIFSKGKETMNAQLLHNESMIFRYKFAVHSHHLTPTELERNSRAFNNKF